MRGHAMEESGRSTWPGGLAMGEDPEGGVEGCQQEEGGGDGVLDDDADQVEVDPEGELVEVG
jgi:hypothetical protein